MSLKEFLSAAERDGVTHLKGAVALTLTEEEKKAALRFCETCEDGEGYDVSKVMMKRLGELGLVVHKGGGWYEGTPALEQLQTESQGSN
jgi:phosphodiesterase/alkaline phosphatase D-like protein